MARNLEFPRQIHGRHYNEGFQTRQEYLSLMIARELILCLSITATCCVDYGLYVLQKILTGFDVRT